MPSKVQMFVAAGFAFAAWAVSLASLAALQNVCWDQGGKASALVPVSSFSATMLECNRIYRYWWFVVIFEIVSIIGLIVAVAINSLRSQRASWMGVFAVTSLLYISMTEAFLTAENTGTWANTSDVALPKGRTMTAGCVMTAVMNVLLVVLLGITEVDAAPEVEAKSATI